jgi:hypothetical protein
VKKVTKKISVALLVIASLSFNIINATALESVNKKEKSMKQEEKPFVIDDLNGVAPEFVKLTK